MKLFDYLTNDDFFKPLHSKHQHIYYECIQAIIDHIKDNQETYEFDAKAIIKMKLNEIKMDMQETETEEVPMDNYPEDLQPSVILATFRECGWITDRQLGPKGEYLVNITTPCRRIMEALKNISEYRNEGRMSNKIFAMHEILKAFVNQESYRHERPYANLLIPLRDNASEWRLELTELKERLSFIIKEVISFQDINSFGQYILKDEMLERFFGEYFFIKDNGMIPALISDIKSNLRIFQESEFYEKAIKECALTESLSNDNARDKINSMIIYLQDFLTFEYQEHLELIDNKINNYYTLANNRIRLLANNGINMENVLNDVLELLRNSDETQAKEILLKLSDCVRITNHKYVGHKSYETYKKRVFKTDNIGLEVKELSEEEKERLTKQMFKKEKYGKQKVSKYIESVLKQKDQLKLNELDIKSKEQALIFARAITLNNDKTFDYAVDIKDDMVDFGFVEMSNMVVRRKKKEV